MAVLMVFAMQPFETGSKYYYFGDVVSVLPDGQHPGNDNARMNMFAYIHVPGTVEDWSYLELPGVVRVQPEPEDPEQEPQDYYVGKRMHRLTYFDAASQQEIAEAINWATHPSTPASTFDEDYVRTRNSPTGAGVMGHAAAAVIAIREAKRSLPMDLIMRNINRVADNMPEPGLSVNAQPFNKNRSFPDHEGNPGPHA